MPSADQHRIKAERNAAFLDSISRDDHLDWVVVATFYTAIHLVERLRATIHKGHSDNHEDRLEYIQEMHPEIHTPYQVLENASKLARYHSMAAFYAQFQRESVEAFLLNECLAAVRNYVSTVLT